MASNVAENESEDVFEVEKIIGMTKTKNKKTLFRVRWLGYGPDHDTWEPYENLDSCRSMVDKYIKNEDQKRRERSKKKASPEPVPEPVPEPTPVAATSVMHKKAPTWKYVSADQDEFDTLKDKFWRDLEQGRVDVFKAGDMYSKVKASGRASRPKSFTEMFQNKSPVSDDSQPQRAQTATRGRSSKGSGTHSKGKRLKSVSTPDSESSISTVSSGPSRPRATHVPKARRGHGGQSQGGNRGRRTGGASFTQSYPYGHSPSIDNMDTTSVGSCDTVSSMDTQSLATSEDSNQGYEMSSRHGYESRDGYEVEIKEDIVGILPMSAGQSPDHSPCFSPISLEKEVKTEVDLRHRTDCTTAPNSVASSATSASSANESGIVADSGSQAHTPKDCSDIGDNVEVIDLDQSIHRKRKLDSLCSEDTKRGKSKEFLSHSLHGELTDQLLCDSRSPGYGVTRTSGQISSSDWPHHNTSSHTTPQLTTNQESTISLYPGVVPSTQGPGGPDPYPVSQAYATYMNQAADSDIPSCLALPDDLGSDLMPLNQIQPTIGNLMSDKSILNNNKGDEEYEFDLEDMDPSEWEGKIAPKIALPDVLEMSNAELRQLVQINDYERVVRALRAKKMYDLEQPDHSGMTLAMIAAQHGYDDTLELLMLRGANMNTEQKNGTTSLMLACEQGLRCTVALLLEMGAHMNKHNHSGDTALIKAVKCGHKHIVKLLLDHGANFASPYNTDTPLRWARHQRDILDLLNAHTSRLKGEFEHQVQITLNNTAHIICALFPLQCFALREADKLKVIFKHELQPTKPGVGMLLFVGHACIMPQEVRCRFYGPCAVQSAVLNGVKLGPLTEEGNFVMSFCPLHNGRNELEILTAKAPTSKAKLIVCAFKAQLL